MYGKTSRFDGVILFKAQTKTYAFHIAEPFFDLYMLTVNSDHLFNQITMRGCQVTNNQGSLALWTCFKDRPEC